MRKLLLLITGLILAAVAVRLSLFTVDRTEFVYVTQFGRHMATYDGEKATEAGLHLKWPWPVQSVQSLDRRLHFFDLPGAELLTHDAKGKTIDKTLTIDAYVCWSIASKDGVDRFIRTVGTPDRARTILGQRVSSELGALIGQMELEDLISTEPGRVDKHREELRRRLLQDQGLQKSALEDYGIDMVDIRLRRSNHPAQVRDAIFARIRSERDKKAADYRSEGEKRAKDIESTALARVQTIEAEALAKKRELEGEGDARADVIRNQAHAKDPQFYAFLKKLEEYQRILGDNRTVLLLSAHRELFDTLFKPPQIIGNGVPRPGTSGVMAPKQPMKTGGQ